MAWRLVETPLGKTWAKVFFPFETRHKVKERVDMRDGTVYARMINGMMVRMEPQRPYRGKSGRRMWKKARRIQREALA